MASRHSRAVIFGAASQNINFNTTAKASKHNSFVSEVSYYARSYPSCLLYQHHLVPGGMRWISVRFLWAGVWRSQTRALLECNPRGKPPSGPTRDVQIASGPLWDAQRQCKYHAKWSNTNDCGALMVSEKSLMQFRWLYHLCAIILAFRILDSLLTKYKTVWKKNSSGFHLVD